MRRFIICLFMISLTLTVSAELKLNLPFLPKKIDYNQFINHDLIEEVVIINEDTKSLDWSKDDNLIATSRYINNNYFNIIVFKPRKERNNECVLLKGVENAPEHHNGNPAWHPSGRYLIFTAQNDDALGYLNKKFAIPGTGMNCNLWVIDTKEKKAWKLSHHLTTVRDTKAVIHPQFSNDGNKVIWAERRRDHDKTSWGQWVIKLADFKVKNGEPDLELSRVIKPVEKPCFYESHDFSPEDSEILFSGNLEPDQPENGMDIYIYNLENEKLTNLTNSKNQWDEHAHFSPDGSKVVWMSSKDIGISWGSIKGHRWQDDLRTDLWIMNRDGTGKQRLTYFNKIDKKDQRFGKVKAIVSDNAWSPAGKSIIATVVIVKGYKKENKTMLFKLKGK